MKLNLSFFPAGPAFTVILICSAFPAFANIPVNDAAQLDRRSETAGVTTKLVPITGQRKDANAGVKCAVTTGRKADVKDPATPSQSGTGTRMIQSYAPSMPSIPSADAKGGELASQNFFKTTGEAVSNLEVSRSGLAAAQSAFRTAGQQIGTAQTVMASLDMNSGARIQNGFAWNGAINSANIWLAAINALSLALVSDTSRAANAMQMRGQVRETAIGTTSTGQAALASRQTDSMENVTAYLANLQSETATPTAVANVSQK